MSAPEHYDVLIVGGGHGGTQVAVALRQRQYAGTIAVVSDEPHLPYERPALSKEYLAGGRTFERMLLRPETFWRDLSIPMRLGSAVTRVDPVGRTVTLADGVVIRYGRLVWAAGGRPRTLSCPGTHLRGIHTLRSRGDVDRLRQELPAAARVVIVGGGYLGLEAAATLSKLGKQVTVAEALGRVLSRVTAEPLSRFIAAEHLARGVDIRVDAVVERIEGDDTRVSGVRLRGAAEVLPADIVIVGIGIVPVVEPLLAAGAQGANGVLVDEFGRTSLPHIYAIGDCALHHNAYAGSAAVRVESVQNAADMALTVARAITGELEPYRALPWFWSSQYDLRVQIAGISAGHDDWTVRGDMASRSFSVIYRRQGCVIAIDCVNAGRDFMQGRTLVHKRVQAERRELADTRVALRDLVVDGTIRAPAAPAPATG
jgi:3-phenylpropionate/trans-cinnamate dioxygenase ferredoxin reductase component